MRREAFIMTIFLIVHHTIATLHGDAHNNLAILLSDLQNLFVGIVLILLPIVAVILLWTRFAGTGLWVMLLSMASSLAFDVYHHYILISPDHIAHLPDGPVEHHTHFIWTANAIAGLQLIGVVLAIYFLIVRNRKAA